MSAKSCSLKRKFKRLTSRRGSDRLLVAPDSRSSGLCLKSLKSERLFCLRTTTTPTTFSTHEYSSLWTRRGRVRCDRGPTLGEMNRFRYSLPSTSSHRICCCEALDEMASHSSDERPTIKSASWLASAAFGVRPSMGPLKDVWHVWQVWQARQARLISLVYGKS